MAGAGSAKVESSGCHCSVGQARCVTAGFSGNPGCTKASEAASWNVPKDTLTLVYVRLKQPILVQNAGLDLSKLEKMKGNADLIDHYIYTDKDGFAVEVQRGLIGSYTYGISS
jgi:hypothetical protein